MSRHEGGNIGTVDRAGAAEKSRSDKKIEGALDWGAAIPPGLGRQKNKKPDIDGLQKRKPAGRNIGLVAVKGQNKY